MNIPFYIASRIAKSSTAGHSGTIIKIAIFTISLSIATMILATAILYGFKSGITQKVFGFWGHIHITDSKVNRSLELSPILDQTSLKRSIQDINYDDLDFEGRKFSSQGKSKLVTAIHPFIMLPAIMNRKSDLEGIILKGINQEYDWNNFKQYLKVGEFPKLNTGSEEREILISEQTSKRLKVKVGDKLVIYFLEEKESIKKAFAISGIYRTGLEEYDVKFAFVDMSVLQDVLAWEKDQVGGFEVFIDDIRALELVADHIYNDILPPNLYAQTIQEKFDGLFEWIELQDMNAVLLMLLMMIVAIINMSTALLILILERSRMIGILKAVGANNWTIRKVFIYVSLWIMALSLLLGNVLGIGFAYVQKWTGILKLDETNYYLSEVPIQIDVPSILMVNLATVLMTLLFMILPSYLITRISIIRILRFE